MDLNYNFLKWNPQYDGFFMETRFVTNDNSFTSCIRNLFECNRWLVVMAMLNRCNVRSTNVNCTNTRTLSIPTGKQTKHKSVDAFTRVVIRRQHFSSRCWKIAKHPYCNWSIHTGLWSAAGSVRTCACVCVCVHRQPWASYNVKVLKY